MMDTVNHLEEVARRIEGHGDMTLFQLITSSAIVKATCLSSAIGFLLLLSLVSTIGCKRDPTAQAEEAFARAQADGVNASDEAGLVERIGHDVHVVLGSERNMKITRPADMELARFYLELERKKA